MQACTNADEKFGHYTASGMPYDLPGLAHSSGQSILLEPGKWFAFLNKRPQRGEMANVETGSEPYDETQEHRFGWRCMIKIFRGGRGGGWGGGVAVKDA